MKNALLMAIALAFLIACGGGGGGGGGTTAILYPSSGGSTAGTPTSGTGSSGTGTTTATGATTSGTETTTSTTSGTDTATTGTADGSTTGSATTGGTTGTGLGNPYQGVYTGGKYVEYLSGNAISGTAAGTIAADGTTSLSLTDPSGTVLPVTVAIDLNGIVSPIDATAGIQGGAYGHITENGIGYLRITFDIVPPANPTVRYGYVVDLPSSDLTPSLNRVRRLLQPTGPLPPLPKLQ